MGSLRFRRSFHPHVGYGYGFNLSRSTAGSPNRTICALAGKQVLSEASWRPPRAASRRRSGLVRPDAASLPLSRRRCPRVTRRSMPYSARSAAINVNVSSISLLCTPRNTARSSPRARPRRRGVILSLPSLRRSRGDDTGVLLRFPSPKRKSDSTITCCRDSEAILQPFVCSCRRKPPTGLFSLQPGLREPASSGCLCHTELIEELSARDHLEGSPHSFGDCDPVSLIHLCQALYP